MIPAAPLRLAARLAAPATRAQPGCPVLSLSCHAAQAVDSWFASVVRSAINPLFGLLGRTLLATPRVGGPGQP